MYWMRGHTESVGEGSPSLLVKKTALGEETSKKLVHYGIKFLKSILKLEKLWKDETVCKSLEMSRS